MRKYVAGKGELFKSLRTTNLQQAVRRAEKIVIQWLGTHRADSSVRFEAVAFELLNIYSEGEYKTFVDFETTLRLHLLPFFERKPIAKCEGLWNTYRIAQRRMTPGRQLVHDKKHMTRILRYAWEKGIIHRQPILKLSPAERRKQPTKIYSGHDLRQLMEAVPREKNAQAKWQLFLEIAMIEGMRFKEIRTLRWDYIDLKRGQIHLPAEITKTRSARTVSVDAGIISKLKERKLGSESPYVFPKRGDLNAPMSESSKTWQRIKTRAGVTGKFHWIRHTAASHALADGIPSEVIGKARGMSPGVLRRVYAHTLEETEKKMSEASRKRIDAAIKGDTRDLS